MTRGAAEAQYVDGAARVTGAIDYVLNFTVPGMAHVAIVRSPYPHARIVATDLRAAEKVRGVVGVITAREVRDVTPRRHFGPIFRDQPILAEDRVRYVGEPVAAVAAIDRETAKEAASLVEVEYEELPAVTTIDEALAEEAPIIIEKRQAAPGFADLHLHETEGTNYCNHFRLQRGDVEAGFEEADFVVEDTFTTSGSQHVPLEPHAVLAQVDGNGTLTVWSSTQTPYLVRAQLAEMFSLPQNRVRVVVPSLGGGFGAKTYPKLEPLTAVLAYRLGLPVKLVLDRTEEFLTIKNHESVIRMKTGVKRDGRLVAREAELWWDAGAYADISPRFTMFGGFYAPGPYRIPNVKVTSHSVYTNKVPSGAFRGYAGPQCAYAFETQLDAIADSLGIDAIKLREINILVSGDRYATGEKMDDLHFGELLDDAASAIRWGTTDDEVAEEGRRRGKGVAAMMMATITPSTSEAVVKVNADGGVEVLSSTVEMGQGARTALSQIAAEAMTVPLDRVVIVGPDTDVTPFDLTTSASRSTFMMGGAVKAAADNAKRQIVDLAGQYLEAHPRDLVVRDGGVFFVGTAKGASFGEILAGTQSGSIIADGRFETHGGLRSSDGQGIASAQWHQCAAGAEVEVDIETGVVKVTRLHVNTYSGKTINRRNAELQLEGGAIFGLGAALTEEMLFEDGQPLNPNLAEYFIPSFRDVPVHLTVRLIESKDSEAEIHGLGENGVGPVPAAIGNAIARALGVRVKHLPITPERLLRETRSGLHLEDADQ